MSVDSRLDLGRDEQAVVHDRRAQQDGALETRREHHRIGVEVVRSGMCIT